MKDDPLMPAERLEFYNTFGRQAVISAVEAIDDSVEQLTGRRCDDALRGEIELIIRTAWNASGPEHDISGFLVPTAALICNAITDSLHRDVFDELGAVVIEEVHRALRNLLEALVDIHRDVLLDSGFSPDDPRLKRP